MSDEPTVTMTLSLYKDLESKQKILHELLNKSGRFVKIECRYRFDIYALLSEEDVVSILNNQIKSLENIIEEMKKKQRRIF